jgi:hypothetical protein
MADSNHTPLPGEWLLLSEALKRKVDELRSSELAKRWLVMELDAKRIRFRFRAHDFVQHSGEDLSGLLWQAATVDWEQSSAVQAMPRRIMSPHMHQSELMRENQRGSHGFPKVLRVNEPTEAEKIAERTLFSVEVWWTEPAAASAPAEETRSAKSLIKAEVDRRVSAGEHAQSITKLSKSIAERLKTRGVHRYPRTIENYLRALKLWPLPTKK